MVELRAHCKINLGLRIVRRRADGFHDIETVMMPVAGLYDTVFAEAFPGGAVFPGGAMFPGGVSADPFLSTTPLPYPAPAPVFPTDSVLEVSGLAVDCPPEQNICMRALRLMQSEYGIGEALIRLRKVVPSGAGLGGGSADAAATLRALNEEFVLELQDADLERLAARLGSDVPFFVRSEARNGGGAQFCTGRGEVMTPSEVDLTGRWLVILKPATSVSTAEAYAGVTPHEAGPTITEILYRPLREWREVLHNDFEESVFARRPETGSLKQALYDAGALYASMSGSGSAVFGIFDRRPDGFGRQRKPGETFCHIEQL